MTDIPGRLIELACGRLPLAERLPHRARLRAELAALPPGAMRWRYALEALAVAWHLAGDVDPNARHGLCLLGYHRYRRGTTDDGGRYEQCVRCHKIVHGSWWGTSVIGTYQQWNRER